MAERAEFPSPVDEPGATPLAARALAPDLARGAVLLFIALANVHLFGWGEPIGSRGYPAELVGIDQVVAFVQMMFVDGRAYPLFALLFGYGVGQLVRRRSVATGRRLVRRRGWWMLLFGLVHALLLFSGDIIGPYGLIAVIAAGLLVAGSDRALLVTAGVFGAITVLFYAGSGLTLIPGATTFVPSTEQPSAVVALAMRAGEWLGFGLVQALGLVAMVCVGAWAARRRFLDDPAEHRALLRRVALIGLGGGAALGIPLALYTAGWWPMPFSVILGSGALHAAGGYLAGAGYAAVVALVVVRLGSADGPVSRALVACGRRSMTCYVAQSVAFVALLPAWTLGLGENARLWQLALFGFGAWLAILLVAAVADRAGMRGPLETLLRRLTYRSRARTT